VSAAPPQFEPAAVAPPHEPPDAVPLAARLPAFDGLAVDPRAALEGSCLGVIGAGSIGRGVVERAARLHIGTIHVVDPGRFKAESMLTHCSLEPGEASRGEPKARSAAELASRISPAIRACYHTGPFEDLGPAALVDADMVVLATDNLAAEIAVAQHCLHLAKPLLHAAVYGDALVAQLRCYTNRPGRGPCLRCRMTAEEEDLLNGHVVFKCTGIPGDRTVVSRGRAPTMSTAFLCSLAADLTMNQVLRSVLDLGAPIADCQVEWCGYTWRTVVSPLPDRSATCRCDHRPWRVQRLGRPIEKATLRQLVAASGLSGQRTGLSVQVDNLLFVDLGLCERCGLRPVRRFLCPGREADTCGQCGGPVTAQPFFSSCPTPLSKLEGHLDVELGRLGAAGAAGVIVRGMDAGVLFHSRPDCPGKEA